MSEKYLYILMRTDLGSLSTGRAAAQASHAANAFWHTFGKTEDAKDWAKQTSQGFGTAIVLGATIDQIRECLTNTKGKFLSACVIDPDYAITFPAELLPFMDKCVIDGINNNRAEFIEQSKTDPTKYILHRKETTCAYILGNKEELSPILGGLSLYS
jgi:hypothetical protein